MTNLVGKRFGRLKITEFVRRKGSSYFWRALCDCGRTIVGRFCASSQRVSCGCRARLSGNILKDLTGKKFGRLKVLEPSYSQTYIYKSGNTTVRFWRVRCDCGTIKDVAGTCLASGGTRSCGCIKVRQNAADLKGRRFGLLTVISYAFSRNGTYWNVRCTCGKRRVFRGASLKFGNARNCGRCIKRKQHWRTAKLKGRRFGSLKVVSLAEYIPYRGSRIPVWLCQCDCGNVVKRTTGHVQKMKSCGCLITAGNIKRFHPGLKEAEVQMLARLHSYKNGSIKAIKEL